MVRGIFIRLEVNLLVADGEFPYIFKISPSKYFPRNFVAIVNKEKPHPETEAARCGVRSGCGRF